MAQVDRINLPARLAQLLVDQLARRHLIEFDPRRRLIGRANDLCDKLRGLGGGHRLLRSQFGFQRHLGRFRRHRQLFPKALFLLRRLQLRGGGG